MHKVISISAAAAFSVLAAAGLGRPAPQIIPRGALDLSQPIIPPARQKKTDLQKQAACDAIARAKLKRERKAAKLRLLVANGSMAAV